MTAAAYFELSKQEDAKLNRCQNNMRDCHLGRAQVYAMWALYEQQRLRAPVTE